jgi:uncharacterized protein
MILIDTSYLVALGDPRDALHRRANRWAASVRERLLVTEYVIIEVVNHFSRVPMRSRGHRLLELARTDPGFEYLPAEHQLFAAGLNLHQRTPDKGWSLTDCISMELMHDRGITQALTHDHHFEQAGFEAILRRDPS